MIPTICSEMWVFELSFTSFQSRNRETYDSNFICGTGTGGGRVFQSRNRETYDSNEAWQTQPDQAVAGFNLVIEKLMIPTKIRSDDEESELRVKFQSRNRETYDSNTRFEPRASWRYMEVSIS